MSVDLSAHFTCWSETSVALESRSSHPEPCFTGRPRKDAHGLINHIGPGNEAKREMIPQTLVRLSHSKVTAVESECTFSFPCDCICDFNAVGS